MKMTRGLTLLVMFAFSLATAQEEPYQVPGFPTFDPAMKPFEIVAESEDTLTVRHLHGDLEIPRQPERIVALDEFATELLLALGIKPVGGVHLYDQWPIAYREQAEGVALIRRTGADVNLEALLALEPDLMIGGIGTEDVTRYEQYSRIAPTLIYREWPFYYAWRAILVDLAEIFDKQQEHETFMAMLQTELAGYRERLAPVFEGETVATLYPGENGVGLNGPGSRDGADGRYRPNVNVAWAYIELGFQPSREVIELGDNYFQEVSYELLPSFEADHLIVMAGVHGSDPTPEYHALLAHPLWESIPAVQKGNAYTLAADRAGGPLTLLQLLDTFEKVVLERVADTLTDESE